MTRPTSLSEELRWRIEDYPEQWVKTRFEFFLGTWTFEHSSGFGVRVFLNIPTVYVFSAKSSPPAAEIRISFIEGLRWLLLRRRVRGKNGKTRSKGLSKTEKDLLAELPPRQERVFVDFDSCRELPRPRPSLWSATYPEMMLNNMDGRALRRIEKATRPEPPETP